jgi:uncharacterized membrane protein YoaK (UPF0700 family)
MDVTETLRHSILATLFIALAGFVDAIGFLTLGGLFASFMSGNSTQFALRLGQESWSGAWPAGAVVGLFVVGVVAGRLAATAAGPWGRPLILALEAALLAAAVAPELSSLERGAMMTLAMGAQNTLPPKAGGTKVSLTYVTGTLVNLGERLADALNGSGPVGGWLPFLLTWAGLVAGGAAGAAAYTELGIRALLVPAVAAALLAVPAIADAWRAR